MKTLEILLVITSFVAIVLGVYILLCRGNGGGGQSVPTVTPSSRWPGGGFSPGFVSTQVRNGGRGADTPNVAFN